MNEQKNNGRGIFYGVIGVATLVVAIIGATFAYFTASQNAGQNVITGNMASISFSLSVSMEANPGQATGIIPMSNTMVEAAVSNASGKGVCVDDNGNAVCQIYKIDVTNGSTATMFVDGYVALTGGSGEPKDYTSATLNKTTMRWAQVFATTSGGNTTYSTGGTQTLAVNGGGTQGADPVTVAMTAATDKIDAETADDSTGFNTDKILTATGDINGTTTISGNSYATVKTNFIRVSEHTVEGAAEGTLGTLSTSFTRTADLTSMLVLSQRLDPASADNTNDSATYYFVVWLSETGTNQTANAKDETGQSGLTGVPTSGDNFFTGVVAFNSAQGAEVTATFNGYTAVTPDTKTQTP